jgi:hypothetical protein
MKPWETESVPVQFEAYGLLCEILRAPITGALCGYVGVNPEHPFYGMDYPDLDVHGGITYSDKDKGARDVWWFGFDCSHSCDFMPMNESIGDPANYKDLNYVRNETENLAKQLSEASLFLPST